MKLTIILSAFFLLALSAAAQQKGLYISVDGNFGFSTEEDVNRPITNGYVDYGLNSSWYFSDNWGLTAGITHSKYKYNSMNDVTMMGVENLSYTQLPVGIICKGNGPAQVNAYFSFGVTAYMLKGVLFNEEYLYYNGPYPTAHFTIEDLNKFNFGPYVGGGAYIKLGQRISLLLDAKYATAVFDVRKNGNSFGNYNATDYLTTFTFKGALQVRISTLKKSRHSKEEG